MSKIFIIFLLSLSTLFAAMTSQEPSPKFLAKKIKIFDIRTQGEWKQTGIIKDSIPLTFFDERGQYNVQAFLAGLSKHVKKGESFALICATGNRTHMVSNFLGKNGFPVINLKGGIMKAVQNGVKLVPFK
jgi:rhodanese-related sulfurtransferase